MANILFDLDGTLTDSSEGIINSHLHALEKLGEKSIDRSVIAGWIGPPLRQTYKQFLGIDDHQRLEQAVVFYRQYFSIKGLLENRLYPGIEPLLETLVNKGHRLFLATYKPKVFAEKILQHFDIAKHFTGVYGPELDGSREDKTLLIKNILAEHDCAPESSVMIGDRKYDIEAGFKNGLKTYGVTYGFGSLQELTDAGSDYFCDDTEQLLKKLLLL